MPGLKQQHRFPIWWSACALAFACATLLAHAGWAEGDDHNKTMAESIKKTHPSGKRVFAAAGTLHFVGPQSILKLLEADGFYVERVNFAQPPSPFPTHLPSEYTVGELS